MKRVLIDKHIKWIMTLLAVALAILALLYADSRGTINADQANKIALSEAYKKCLDTNEEIKNCRKISLVSSVYNNPWSPQDDGVVGWELDFKSENGLFSMTIIVSRHGELLTCAELHPEALDTIKVAPTTIPTCK